MEEPRHGAEATSAEISLNCLGGDPGLSKLLVTVHDAHLVLLELDDLVKLSLEGCGVGMGQFQGRGLEL